MRYYDYEGSTLRSRLRSKRMAVAREKGMHTKNEWAEMKSFFGECVRCNGKSGLLNIERDHIIPVYQGGSDSIRNIQPFCARCNASKGPETVDYRVLFCAERGIVFPEKWEHDHIKGGE